MSNAKEIVGIEMILPYPMNCLKLYFTSLSLKIFINIMPAKEPIGVSNAQTLDEATTAYTVFKSAAVNVSGSISAKVVVNIIVIGILFNKFPNAKEIYPVTNIC